MRLPRRRSRCCVIAQAKAASSEKESMNTEGNSFNPFEMPLVLLRQLVVNSVRKSVVNSLDRFLRWHCHVYRPEKAAPAAAGAHHPGGGVKAPSFMRDDAGVGRVTWHLSKGCHGGAVFHSGREPAMSLAKLFKEYTFFCFEEDLKVCARTGATQRCEQAVNTVEGLYSWAGGFLGMEGFSSP